MAGTTLREQLKHLQATRDQFGGYAAELDSVLLHIVQELEAIQARSKTQETAIGALLAQVGALRRGTVMPDGAPRRYVFRPGDIILIASGPRSTHATPFRIDIDEDAVGFQPILKETPVYEMEPPIHWVPLSEGMPEPGVPVFLRGKHQGETWLGQGHLDASGTWRDTLGVIEGEVTDWASIPS